MFKQMKRAAVGVAAATTAGLASAQSAATDPTAALFAAVDLSGVATGVGAMGVVVVGISLALKGISLVKRAISKA